MSIAPGTPPIVEPFEHPRPDIALEEGHRQAQGGETLEHVPRRWWQKQVSPNPWRATVLSGLEKPGCLVCREAERSLRHYYFWFLLEQYAHIRTMDRLQRAHGFCLRHTRHLLEWGVPDRTSYMASYVLRFCADWLQPLLAAMAEEGYDPRGDRRQESVRFRPLVGCPACEDARASSQRYVQVIVRCLEEADIAKAFCASSGLCLPHFLSAAPLARWDALGSLVEAQIHHLEQTRANLSALQASGTDGAGAAALREAMRRLYGPDLDKRIRSFMVPGRGAGHTAGACSGDQTGVAAGESASWSPAFEEACRLLCQPGCSICRAAARGREEYAAWLEEEIRDNVDIGYRWDQALFLCSEHAWLFADRCAPGVLAIACDRLLARMVASLRQFLWDIREPIPGSLIGRGRVLPSRWRESSRVEGSERSRLSSLQRVRRTVGSLWQTPRDFLDRAIARSLRWDACPLCSHLERIEARAADRLVAVVGDAEGRRTFERSYGLCVGHAPLLLERANAGLRRGIAAVLRARIEVDHWEVEEYLRKQSWSRRHEPKGDEVTAWQRASSRIAGMAIERQYGF